jgi:hypothetical protein
MEDLSSKHTWTGKRYFSPCRRSSNGSNPHAKGAVRGIIENEGSNRARYYTRRATRLL